MDFVDRFLSTTSSSSNGLSPDDSLEYLVCDNFNDSDVDVSIDEGTFHQHRSSIGVSVDRMRRRSELQKESVNASIANISNIVLRSKRIRFAEGTAAPPAESIASTIYEHEYVTSSGCVLYKIQV